jgi:pimeloyl-ACP methyl ester carboxylesterase
MDFENPLMKEEAVLFGETRSLVGIMTHPASGNGNRLSPAVILLNPGIVHRVGPGRIYVKIARALAAIGFVVLRFDFSGIGDSGVRRDHLQFEKSAVREAQDAMDWLNATRGIQHFILLGGCSGARIALETACRDVRVVGAVLMNFPMGDDDEGGEGDRNLERMNRRAAYSYWNFALFDLKSWRKLLTGTANYRNLIRVLRFQAKSKVTSGRNMSHQATQFQAQLRQLAGRDVHTIFVCSEGDLCLDDLREAAGRELKRLSALGRLTLKVIPRSDHTFSSLYDQERLLQVILELLSSANPAVAKPAYLPERLATPAPTPTDASPVTPRETGLRVP